MIVYSANKTQFLNDVLTNDIEGIVLKNVKQKLNRGVGIAEIRSWAASLVYMDRIMQDQQIPDDCGVAIEYQIPQTGKRIDFIISGQDENSKDSVLLIELKQWSEAKLTNKDSIVETYVGGRIGEHTHPSYQAWSYATLLQGFNEVVYTENIQLHPCAYLHNYIDDNVIKNDFYSEYIQKAPVFLKSDALKLREFIKSHVKYGDRSNILYRIENGKATFDEKSKDNMTYPANVTRSALSKRFFRPVHRKVLTTSDDELLDYAPDKWLGMRQSVLEDISGLRMHITVPGRTDAEVGKIINFKYPKVGDGADKSDPKNQWDPFLSGVWMITAIHHKITPVAHNMILEMRLIIYPTKS